MRAVRARGVQPIAIGTLNQSGPIISIKLQMIHLASREIVKSLNEVFEGDVNGLMEFMPVLASKFVGQQVSESPVRTERPVSSRAELYSNRKTSIKWYLVGIGLLVAGGIGTGVYLAQKDSGSNGNTTTTPATNLPKPPNFP